jgi:hypothetical protein
MPHWRVVFWFWSFVSASFVVAVLVHAYCLFAPDSSPAWRHALFVALNLGVAWGCWRRPRWFVWAFGLLLVQQLYSHGSAFAKAWPGRVDWQSLLVLIWMPAVAFALWRERKR